MLATTVIFIAFLLAIALGLYLGVHWNRFIDDSPLGEPFQRRLGDVGPWAPVVTDRDARQFHARAVENMRRRVPDSDYDRAVEAFDELGI